MIVQSLVQIATRRPVVVQRRGREAAHAALPGWHEEERGEERGIDVPRVGTAGGKWYGNIRVSQTVSSKANHLIHTKSTTSLESLVPDPH